MLPYKLERVQYKSKQVGYHIETAVPGTAGFSCLLLRSDVPHSVRLNDLILQGLSFTKNLCIIHLFSKYLLSTCYVPVASLGAGNVVSDKILALMEFTLQRTETDN